MSATSRALRVLQLLATEPAGYALSDIANRLDIPAAATHRVLGELSELGFVVRSSTAGEYALSMKLATVALGFLSRIDLVEQARGAIDRLAAQTATLARLSIVDDTSLTWVLKSQGQHSNIRYDPPLDYRVHLASSATGHAWLSNLSDEEAMRIIFSQGGTEGAGPSAPHTLTDVLEHLDIARRLGYAIVHNTYEEGISAVAMAIRNPHLGRVTGVVSLADLSARMTDERVEELLPLLRAETAVLAEARLDYAKYLLPTGRMDRT